MRVLVRERTMQQVGHTGGAGLSGGSEPTDNNHLTSLGAGSETAASAEYADNAAVYTSIPRDHSLVPVCGVRTRYHALMRSASSIFTAAVLKQQAEGTPFTTGSQNTARASVTGSDRTDSQRPALSTSLVHVEHHDAKGDKDARIHPDYPEPIRIIRAYMASQDIEILFDGTMRRTTAPVMSYRREDRGQYLSKDDISRGWLLDHVMSNLRAEGNTIPQGEIDRALRMIEDRDRRDRKKTVVMPLTRALSEIELDDAAREWERLEANVFETHCLSAACLQTFIWQVKQKLLGRPVTRHLMPIIYSAVQGSGKSTFVDKFLAPLQELASKPTLISEFTDSRNVDIFRFPVLNIDDMGQVKASEIDVLKNLMTTGGFRRRAMRSSASNNIVQCATLIGTTNNTVGELVSDKTGHRRFVELQFRNGEVNKGGDRRIWEVINTINYHLLWCSVEAWGPSPINPYLIQLNELQESRRVPDELEEWLCQIDINSEDFRDFVGPHGIQASVLRTLYENETGNKLSPNRFSNAMDRYILNPKVPFGPKTKKTEHRVYAIKPRQTGSA